MIAAMFRRCRSQHRLWLWLLLCGVAGVLALGAITVWQQTKEGWKQANEGWRHHPTVTKKAWGESEVLGTWRYREDYPKAVVEITFGPDGTFQQTVTISGSVAPLHQSGHWAIRKTHLIEEKHWGFSEGQLNVYGVLMCMDGKWTPHGWDWWDLVESEKQPGTLAIYGGTFPDPDVYQEFSRVESTTAPR